jgi:hypothetical protein
MQSGRFVTTSFSELPYTLLIDLAELKPLSLSGLGNQTPAQAEQASGTCHPLSKVVQVEDLCIAECKSNHIYSTNHGAVASHHWVDHQ